MELKTFLPPGLAAPIRYIMKRLAKARRGYLALPLNRDMICVRITLTPINEASICSRKCQKDKELKYPWQRCSEVHNGQRESYNAGSKGEYATRGWYEYCRQRKARDEKKTL